MGARRQERMLKALCGHQSLLAQVEGLTRLPQAAVQLGHAEQHPAALDLVFQVHRESQAAGKVVEGQLGFPQVATDQPQPVETAALQFRPGQGAGQVQGRCRPTLRLLMVVQIKAALSQQALRIGQGCGLTLRLSGAAQVQQQFLCPRRRAEHAALQLRKPGPQLMRAVILSRQRGRVVHGQQLRKPSCTGF